MRVYTQVGKTSQGKFALDVAVKTLGLYKEYVVCILFHFMVFMVKYFYGSNKDVNLFDLMKFRYFAVPYSLPKLDMIAIPDFAAGAMENYGLVTYRETALLYDEKHSAAANKQRVR